MYKRVGACKKCGRCCRSFNLLAGAMSDFKKAQERYGLRIILNPDKKTYRCSMLDKKTNSCKIHLDKPKACQDAPRMEHPKEWNCGYEFVSVDTGKKDKQKTKKALRFFENLGLKPKIDKPTQLIFDFGRKNL
jgi:Fe-S-cluster containining protein